MFFLFFSSGIMIVILTAVHYSTYLSFPYTRPSFDYFLLFSFLDILILFILLFKNKFNSQPHLVVPIPYVYLFLTSILVYHEPLCASLGGDLGSLGWQSIFGKKKTEKQKCKQNEIKIV